MNAPGAEAKIIGNVVFGIVSCNVLPRGTANGFEAFLKDNRSALVGTRAAWVTGDHCGASVDGGAARADLSGRTASGVVGRAFRIVG